MFQPTKASDLYTRRVGQVNSQLRHSNRRLQRLGTTHVWPERNLRRKRAERTRTRLVNNRHRHATRLIQSKQFAILNRNAIFTLLLDWSRCWWPSVELSADRPDIYRLSHAVTATVLLQASHYLVSSHSCEHSALFSGFLYCKKMKWVSLS